MKVCVVGLGYIGLPTALMLAAGGISVHAVDANAQRVAELQAGKIVFEEKGLPELFTAACSKDLVFAEKPVAAEMYIISVPTPYQEESKKLDPAYVVQAVKDVLAVCEDGAILTIESTISPGTVDRFIRPLTAACGKTVHLSHTPERIIPGNMIYELEHNSRTIGADDPAIGEQIRSVYQSFCKGEIVLTDIRTAEMTKVVENTYRDINIAFANELAKICRRANLDVYEIIRIANKHPRVNILQPGPGVGGHCISVDPWFLVGDYPTLAGLIRKAREVNSEMPRFLMDRIYAVMKEQGITDLKRVGLYGLTYKEDVDDVRESPTLQLQAIAEEKLEWTFPVYDPMVKTNLMEGQYQDFDQFLQDVDMVVVMVAHSHLKQNMDRLSGKVVLDTRNACPGAIKM